MDLTTIERYVLAKRGLTLLLQWANKELEIAINPEMPLPIQKHAIGAVERLEAAARVQQERMAALRRELMGALTGL